MLHLITTERQVQLRGGGPASICAYAQRPPRQRLSTNGVFGKVDRVAGPVRVATSTAGANHVDALRSRQSLTP